LMVVLSSAILMICRLSAPHMCYGGGKLGGMVAR
jgi:hypothetical protein